MRDNLKNDAASPVIAVLLLLAISVVITGIVDTVALGLRRGYAERQTGRTDGSVNVVRWRRDGNDSLGKGCAGVGEA